MIEIFFSSEHEMSEVPSLSSYAYCPSPFPLARTHSEVLHSPERECLLPCALQGQHTFSRHVNLGLSIVILKVICCKTQVIVRINSGTNSSSSELKICNDHNTTVS